MADFLLLLAATAVALGAVSFTLQPVLRTSRRSGYPDPTLEEAERGRHNDELFARRDALLVVIRELDFDYAIDKIDPPEYQAQREALVNEAIVALKEIDDALGPLEAHLSASGGGLADEVERRIAQMRRGLDKPSEQHVSRTSLTYWLGGATLAAAIFVGAVLALTLESRQATKQLSAVSTVPQAPIASLAIDPDDPRNIYYGYPGGLLTSRDGGRSWSASPSSLEGIAGLSVTPGSDGAILSVSGESLFVSRDQGKTWEQAAEEVKEPRAVATSSQEPTTAYLVTADGRLFQSKDAGATWVSVASRVPPGVNDLAVVDSQALYVSTATQGVLASADGGKTWANASGFVTGALPTRSVRSIAYDPSSGDSYTAPNGATFAGALYVATDRGVFRSIDAGGTWVALLAGKAAVAVAVDPEDSRIIYAVDESGQVFKSNDKGVTWRAS